VVAFIHDKSTVTPSSILAAPAQVVCPPPRTANRHDLLASVVTASETSCGVNGVTIQFGLSWAVFEKYEFTDDS